MFRFTQEDVVDFFNRGWVHVVLGFATAITLISFGASHFVASSPIAEQTEPTTGQTEPTTASVTGQTEPTTASVTGQTEPTTASVTEQTDPTTRPAVEPELTTTLDPFGPTSDPDPSLPTPNVTGSTEITTPTTPVSNASEELEQVPTPENLRNGNTITRERIVLKWNIQNPDNFDYYVIERKVDGGFVQVGESHNNWHTDLGLAANTIYHHRVVAVDGDGNRSNPSNILATQTLP